MAESGFEIDGKFYEMPSLTSFTMGERRILFELANIVQEELLQGQGEDDDEHDARVREKLRHPGFMEAMLHIAYARGNPKLSRERVASVVEKANALEILVSAVSGDAEDDASPPELTNAPEPRSLPGSDSKTSRSGERSPTISAPPGAIHESIGTGRSDTLRTSDPVTST